jgi:putative hydrolase of the HAD superfamily
MNRVIVFDLDDTLFPEWQYVLSGFKAVDEHLCAIGKCQRAQFYTVAKAFFDEGSRGNIFDLALTKLGLGADKDAVAELVRVYREHKPALTIHEDARWAIDYFRERNHVLGLISDGYLVAQQNKFEALRIAERFAAIVFSDQLGRDAWKPSPLPYQKVMEQIPGPPSDFVYVADNPRKDFITARKLGWSTIHIDRAGGVYHNIEAALEYQADRRITSLFELEQL